MDLQNIFPILFNLGPSSYPKIENSKKFILLSRVNSLVPTYARNLTELTTRFFHGDSSNFTTSFTRRQSRRLANLRAVSRKLTSWSVNGSPVTRRISRDTARNFARRRDCRPVTRRNSRAFVSVASVRMSRHVFIRKML